MRQFFIKNLPDFANLNRNFFSDDCKALISENSLIALKNGKLKLIIHKHGGKSIINNFQLTINAVSGVLKILVGNDNTIVDFGHNVKGNFDLRLWRQSKVVIGNGTTSNGVRIICDNSEFICGSDCMFSDGILVQCADQHGIVDLNSGEITNNDYKSIILGEHVWLGRHSTISSNAKVGDGSVIGTGALVASIIPSNSIAVGVPAKVIKTGHTWCRSPVSLDGYSKNAIDNFVSR